MELVNFFGDYLCKTFNYNKYTLKLIDFDNMNNNINYLYYVADKVSFHNYSKIEDNVNEVLMRLKTLLPFYIIEVEKDFFLNKVKSYIIFQQINSDFISILYISSDLIGSIKTSSSHLNTPFNISNHVPKSVLGECYKYNCAFNKEFKIFNRNIAHLHNQDDFFGTSKYSMIEFEYSLLDKNIGMQHPLALSDLHLVLRMYENGFLFYEFSSQIEPYETIKKGVNYNQYLNKFIIDFLAPFTTDLSLYEPLNFKKATTKKYIKNFEKYIRNLKEMEDI
jgi:hypothetical protein